VLAPIDAGVYPCRRFKYYCCSLLKNASDDIASDDIACDDSWEIKMTIRFTACLLMGMACSTVQAASFGVTSEEDRKAIDQCKSPAQVITYVVGASAPKAVDAPATAEEDDRVRAVMKAAGMTYDRVNRRGTFEFVLGLVRANGVIRFHIGSTDTQANSDAQASGNSVLFDDTKSCLTNLAHEIGMGVEFVSTAQELTDTHSADKAHS
jgi:hypothetical protein